MRGHKFSPTAWVWLAMSVIFAAAWVWFVVLNRYQALYFPEQLQLFQFSRPYFNSHAMLPGGLTSWLGAFLVQFNVVVWLGGLIHAAVVAAAWRLTLSVMRTAGVPERFFAISFVVPLLIMKCLAVTYFEMSFALGIVFALAGLRIVLGRRCEPHGRLGGSVKWLWTLPPAEKDKHAPTSFALVFGVVYLLAAGNAWIDAAGYLTRVGLDGGERKLLLPALAICAVVPVAAFMWPPGHVPVKETIGGLTPLYFVSPSPLYACLWFFVAVLGVMCPFFRRFGAGGESGAAGKISALALTVNLGCGVILGGGFLWLIHDRHSENVIRISSYAAEGRWEEILEIEGGTMPTNVSMAITNLALSHTGQMPYRMFHHRQNNLSGLIPSRNNYLMSVVQSEIYDRLGLPAAAKHSTFEAMIANTMNDDHNAQSLVKLLRFARMEGNRPLFEKYAAILSRSPFYRSEVERQRAMMPERKLEPEADRGADFFILEDHEAVLKIVLEKYPANRTAFEYLMAGYLIDRQLDSAKRCFDTYFAEMGYGEIPDHWAEMLVKYHSEYGLGDDFFDTYKVPRRMREDWDAFELMLTAARSGNGDEALFARLTEKYADTFWYYFNARRS